MNDAAEWVLTVRGRELPNMNRHRHPMELYRLGSAIKDDIRLLLRAQKVPRLPAARIVCFVPVRGNRRLDPGNWSPAAKAAVDAIVAEGVLPDDSWRYVTGPDMRPLPGGERAAFVVKIIAREPGSGGP